MLQLKKAYSLLEMSIVIVITMTLFSAGAFIYGKKIESDKYAETKSRMEEVEKGIRAFVVLHLRLPCPANSNASSSTGYVSGVDLYGSEVYNTTVSDACTNEVGAVPVWALGLDEKYAYDAWGNKFRYGVINACTFQQFIYTTETNGPYASGFSPMSEARSGSYPISFPQAACGTTSFTIKQTNTGATIANNAIMVLVSAGPNGHGAYNRNGGRTLDPSVVTGTDEAYNAGVLGDGTSFNNNRTFIQRDVSTLSSNYNDDLVKFYTKQDILNLAKLNLLWPNPADISYFNPECETAVYAGLASRICPPSNGQCFTDMTELANIIIYRCLFNQG